MLVQLEVSPNGGSPNGGSPNGGSPSPIGVSPNGVSPKKSIYIYIYMFRVSMKA